MYRYIRRRQFDRSRHNRKFRRYLTAAAARLGASATGQTVDTVDVAAAAAAGVLTFGANAANNKIVTIDSTVYTFKTALTEAKAAGVLTLGANAANNNTVTLGVRVYTFKDTLTGAANEVKVGAAATNSIDNLILAITAGAGAGTNYGTGTVAHADVTAAAGAGDTMDVTAKVVGVAGNSIASSTTIATSSFAAATLLGGVAAIANQIKIGAAATNSLDNLIAAITAGVGEGSTYSTGTIEHVTVDAAAGTGDTMDAVAKTAGVAGNQIVTSTDVASASWGAITLVGGSDATFGPTLAATTHGITTGEGPYVITSSGALPGGYVAGTKVWVRNVSTSVVSLHPSRADAILNTEAIDFTSAGTGTLTLKKLVTIEGMFELLKRNGPDAVKNATDVDSLS